MLAFVVMKQCFAWAAAGFSLGYVPMEKAQWRTFPPALPLPLSEMAFLLSASVYGAFQEERFCGLAVIRKDEHGWGEILDLRVDASCRRQGIATALLASCEGFARRRSLEGLRITVSRSESGNVSVSGSKRFSGAGCGPFSVQPLAGGTSKTPCPAGMCAVLL